MELDAQRLVARQFYEENHVKLFETIWYERYEGIAPTFERIASIRVGNLSPFEVQIEKINQNVPQSISDAFARHLWYSHWSLKSNRNARR